MEEGEDRIIPHKELNLCFAHTPQAGERVV
jgi:hypothetical protein